MNEPNPSLKYKMVLCCLFAPAFHANFSNLTVLIFDKIIGFEPTRVTYFGVFGCHTESWMGVAYFFTFVPFNVALIWLGYTLSKHASVLHKLLGAVLLFTIPYTLGYELLNIAFGYHPWAFLDYKEKGLLREVPVFGNSYTFAWVSFSVRHVLLLFYSYLCYRVVFKYWDTQMRIYFFTYGAIACALGLYGWYFLVGPFVYR
ncbi:MAG: hypothetical protein V4590_05130 [Bacteroidota bacterium]